MKVTAWAIVALVVACATLATSRPAQGCPEAQRQTAHVRTPPKVAPRPVGHRSFIIAARMGWL
jgi:hypothetical protein